MVKYMKFLGTPILSVCLLFYGLVSYASQPLSGPEISLLEIQTIGESVDLSRQIGAAQIFNKRISTIKLISCLQGAQSHAPYNSVSTYEIILEDAPHIFLVTTGFKYVLHPDSELANMGMTIPAVDIVKIESKQKPNSGNCGVSLISPLPTNPSP